MYQVRAHANLGSRVEKEWPAGLESLETHIRSKTEKSYCEKKRKNIQFRFYL